MTKKPYPLLTLTTVLLLGLCTMADAQTEAPPHDAPPVSAAEPPRDKVPVVVWKVVDGSELRPDGIVPRPRGADRFELGEVCSGHRRQPLVVELAVMEPPGPARGTVLLCGGGGGELWFGAGPVVEDIRRAGYRVVQRRWFPGYRDYSDPFTWTPHDGAELALLLESLSEKYGHRLCAVGSSGGGIEMAEAFGHHRAHRFVAHAVFMAGPSFARFDMRVDGGAAYTEACQRAVERYEMDLKAIHALTARGVGCPEDLCRSMLARYRDGIVIGPRTPGQGYVKLLEGLIAREQQALEVLQNGTIMRPGFSGLWPDTTVSFISGALDLSSVGAVQLAEGIKPKSKPSVHVVPDRRHDLFQDGKGAIRTEPVGSILLASIRDNYVIRTEDMQN